VTAPDQPRPGTFITLEGPEGAGKTTQAELLERHLAGLGTPTVLVREPGGTPLGEEIRAILLGHREGGIGPRTDALLFNAARAQLVEDVIRPALLRGETVISTRFSDSTLAYQGYGLGLPLDALQDIEAFATGGLVPDRTVLLDLAVEAGLARKAVAERTRFETAFDVSFHERVREGFIALARREPGRFVVVDAAAEPEKVFTRIVEGLGLGAVDRARGSAAPEPKPGPLRIQQ
jgi:dTMP kinase